MIRFLLWVGFVTYVPDAVYNGVNYRPAHIRWPFSAPPKWQRQEFWSRLKRLKNPFVAFHGLNGWTPYRFRNLPHVVKWQKGRLLPRRWGFGWMGSNSEIEDKLCALMYIAKNLRTKYYVLAKKAIQV